LLLYLLVQHPTSGGINTNMCAALLHVLSDLMRSTTTLVRAASDITRW
jgi:Co/Zn/Cd efflux system component